MCQRISLAHFSHMRQITYRLKPGELLKESIEALVQNENIMAGCLVSLVGSLSHAVLRMAGATADHSPVKEWSEPVEIVSATGTISVHGCHVHIGISDKNGMVFGGHLKNGCVVATTVEIILLIFTDVEYKRLPDPDTGFDELAVTQL